VAAEKRDGSRGIFVYTRGDLRGAGSRVAGQRERSVPIFSSVIFGAVQWAARKGLRGEREDVRAGEVLPESEFAARKLEARRTGVRGETYAYWYLRRQGYVFVARNYMPRGAKGEIDLIGYDGKTLAFVEVRTRTVREELTALPELSVTTDKQRVVVRTGAKISWRAARGRVSLPVRRAGD
jgi:Holliday junction resolvase-like predicted endonuclease